MGSKTSRSRGRITVKVLTSARLALMAVVGGLALAIAAFAPVYAGNHGDPGNKQAGCNQNKPTPEQHYDADCDGSASENGGGHENAGANGNGGGKPCAGCVGKADNKHPPGQEPNEDDRNKGYECDDNKGVGAQRGTGNPAHTGCRVKSTSTNPPPKPPGSAVNPSGNPPSNPPVNPPGNPPDEVLPTMITNGGIDDNEGPRDETAAERAPQGRALPLTGTNLVMLLVIAGSLIGAGIASRLISKR